MALQLLSYPMKKETLHLHFLATESTNSTFGEIFQLEELLFDPSKYTLVLRLNIARARNFPKDEILNSFMEFFIKTKKGNRKRKLMIDYKKPDFEVFLKEFVRKMAKVFIFYS